MVNTLTNDSLNVERRNELNTRETLAKLHKEFPQLTLDDLFKILDCIVIYTKIEFNPNINVRY